MIDHAGQIGKTLRAVTGWARRRDDIRAVLTQALAHPRAFAKKIDIAAGDEFVGSSAAVREVQKLIGLAASSVAGGSYSLGGVALQVQDGAVRAPEGMLAGSLLTMIEAVRNLHLLGVPIEDALAAASTVPARALGLRDAGRLDVGLPADVVVLDDNLDIERVMVGGDTRVVV